MAQTKTTRLSFSGGEITPEMYGRFDNGKNQTGLALCRNAVVLPHGPVTKRPGLAYVLKAKGSATAVRVLPFVFSATQSMVLEFGDFYLRFHTGGATLLEANQNITGITQAAPGVVTIAAHGYTNGDWVYVASVGGMTSVNGRYYIVAGATANTFQLTNLDGTNEDTSAFSAYTAGGTAARVYTIATPYAAADLFDLNITQDADVLTITSQSLTYAPRELRRLGAVNWALTAPALGASTTAPTSPTATATAGTGTAYPKNHYYKVTTVTADGLEESLPVGPTAAASCDLALPGAKIVVAWTAPGGVSSPSYRVYKASNTSGRLYGYIGETLDVNFTDDNITPDYSRTPPSAVIRLDTATNYPAAVTYYEQRRVFGGTAANPQSVFMTRTGTESNLSTSMPAQSADAIQFKIKAQQQNAIRHLFPLGDLIALTAGGVWRIFSNNDQGLLPSTVAARPQSYDGASKVRPLLTGTAALYVESTGKRIRDISFSSERGSYLTDDRSIMAPHLFNDYTIVDATFARSPDKTAWVVRDDGVLLSFTYVPEHQVFAWSQHSTDGDFESLCTVLEDGNDVVYAVVARTLNGQGTRTIERMASRQFATQADAFFVDCGATYTGAAVTSIVVPHLANEAVVILADGAVVAGKVADARGTITLDTAAETVHIGKRFTADVQTLPMAIDRELAFGRGAPKNVGEVYILVNRSGLFKIGPSETTLVQPPARSNEPYDTPPALRSEEIDVLIDPQWDSDGQVWIRSEDPVPLTVSALAFKVALGG